MNLSSGYKNLGLIAVAALALAGCAGKDFVRPDPTSLVLGKTTQQELTEKMGKPVRTGTLDKNGKTIQSATYAYANVGGDTLHSGVTGARAQGFYFLDGVLVGTEFTSSFKSDGTDFDETRADLLEKGKSTRADAIKLFGPAGGEYIAPLVSSPAERALVYLYSQTKGSAFNLRQYVKTLVISYNDKAVITDIQYTAQGNKD